MRTGAIIIKTLSRSSLSELMRTLMVKIENIHRAFNLLRLLCSILIAYWRQMRHLHIKHAFVKKRARARSLLNFLEFYLYQFYTTLPSLNILNKHLIFASDKQQ